MIHITSFIIASLMPSKTANTGLERLPIVVSAMANNMAKTMIGNNCISVAEANRLGEISDMKISDMPVPCFSRIRSGTVALPSSIPAPGWIILTTTKPIKTATAVVRP